MEDTKMTFQIPVFGELALSFNPGVLKISDESQSVNFGDTSPVTIGTIKAHSHLLVVGAIVDIKTAFAGTAPVLDIGITADPDRYADQTEIAATTAGIKVIFGGAASRAEENPSADQAVLATIGGSALSAGVATVRLIYVDIANLT
jgi:hypothetical protein